MPQSTSDQLPQFDEIWYLAVRRLDLLLADPGEQPHKPDSIWIYNLDRGLIQAVALTEPDPPPDQIQDLLVQAVEDPPISVKAPPHRPAQLYIENPDHLPIIQDIANTYQIEVAHHPLPHLIDDLADDFSYELKAQKETPVPGLLSVDGVSPKIVRSLFKAAARFFLAAPWNELDNLQTLAIQVEGEEKPRVVVVMGDAGMEYGLNVFPTLIDFEKMLSSADDQMVSLPDKGLLALHFDDASYLPADDLKNIKKYHWQVIDKQHYPAPMIFHPEGYLERPGVPDLLFLEAAMLAIPIALSNHLESDQSGNYQPFQSKITVTTHDGEMDVQISYPAGDISRSTLPVSQINAETETDRFSTWEMEGMEGLPDPRAMEGVFGFSSDSYQHPEVQQAQEVMYQAWDENNPAKRLILAHQALSISKDCADAYVLLAEEEASSLQEAFDLYQEGFLAGKRALGESYFEENEGHFWGLMITRPYMRARKGLASMLWNMGRRQEALEHFQEMLRLNPMDNQGIRYLLLLLLMELNQGEEVDAHLKDHQEDSAEWLYTSALRLFQVSGRSEKANRILEKALKNNPYIPAYLLSNKRIPHQLPPGIIIGEESEAVVYAAAYLAVWRKTEGALDWLKSIQNS